MYLQFLIFQPLTKYKGMTYVVVFPYAINKSQATVLEFLYSINIE